MDPSSSIFTHLSEADKRTLRHLATSPNGHAVTVLEIGSYLGASACILAESAQASHGKVYCVDTWTNIGMSEGFRDTYGEFMANTRQFAATIHPIKAPSTEAANLFVGEIDFLFVDGDHSFEGCRDDLKCWLPKVREGGIVALHDFSWAEGVQQAARDFLLPYQDGPGYWEGNIYWTHVTRQPSEPAPRPITVSVVIPTLKPAHEFADLQRQFESALPGRSELLVVHTGQPANQTNGSVAPANPRHIYEPTPGLLAGRHRGFRESRGEIVIYLDDDVRVGDGWLAAMLEPFADPAVHLVGCRYLPDYEMEPPSWMDRLWTEDAEGKSLPALSLLDYGTATKEINPALVWGLCYAIRRDTLTKLGGFHPDAYPWELRRFRGDGETAPSLLARQLKLKAIYQGKATVHHQVPRSRLTPEYFARRAYLQGVSDSYSRIRAEGKPPASESPLRRTLRAAKHSARLLLRGLKNAATPAERQSARAYAEGYRFHQDEVQRDPALLAWVLRPDYWDYAPPIAPLEPSASVQRVHGT